MSFFQRTRDLFEGTDNYTIIFKDIIYLFLGKHFIPTEYLLDRHYALD